MKTTMKTTTRNLTQLTTFLLVLLPAVSSAHTGIIAHAEISNASLHSIYHAALQGGILMLLGLAVFFITRQLLKRTPKQSTNPLKRSRKTPGKH